MKLFIIAIFFPCAAIATSVIFTYTKASTRPCIKYIGSNKRVSFYGECTTLQYTILNTIEIKQGEMF